MKKICISALFLCASLLLVSCSSESHTNPIIAKATNPTPTQAGQADVGGADDGAQSGGDSSPNVAWGDSWMAVGGANNINMNRLVGRTDMMENAHGDIMVSNGISLYAYRDSTGIITRGDINKCRILDATIAVTEEGADTIIRDMGTCIGMGIVDQDHLCIVTVADPALDRDNPYIDTSKALLFKLSVNGESNMEKLDEFYIQKDTKCIIVGNWCYYQTSTVKLSGSQTSELEGTEGLARRSLLDGTVQTIAEYAYDNPPGDINLTFGEGLLLYTVKERDAATDERSWVVRKMDLVTGEIEVVPFLQTSYIAAIYDGQIYYTDYLKPEGTAAGRIQLLRVPIAGGTPELVIDFFDGLLDGGKINIANDTIYFLLENDLLYRIPLSQIGIDRKDADYIVLNHAKSAGSATPIVSGGLWIWGGNVWLYSNIEGDGSQLKVLDTE